MFTNNNTIIAVFLEPSFDFVSAVFAIIRSGSAFLPVDINLPESRVNFMLEECNVNLLITNSILLKKVKSFKVKNVILVDKNTDSLKKEEFNFKIYSKVDSLITGKKLDNNLDNNVYVVYTSGSTGKPKGVPITHSNLLPLMLWQQKHFKLKKGIKVLHNLPFSFDFGIQEIFTTILFGGTLYFVEKFYKTNAKDFSHIVDKYNITMFYATPEFIKIIIGEYKLSSLKFILLGGESLEWEIIKNLYNCVNKCSIYNGYGPTEASINSTMFLVTDQCFNINSQTVPIGSVSGNSKVYILDESLNIVPIGVTGEIYIGGDGISKGYINKNESQNDKFIDNFFIEGQKMYRTGDLARYIDDNGNIEFVGRKDTQYKINGYRVELAEIENILKEQEEVVDCVVVVFSKNIIAFINSSKNINIEKLQFFISNKLPLYMLPKLLLQVDEIPVSNNGKINMQKLKSIYNNHLIKNEQESISKESNSLQENILDIWKNELGLLNLSVDDNFFDMGAHSLMISKVYGKIIKKININFPIIKVFQYPSVKLLVEYLKNYNKENSIYTNKVINVKKTNKKISSILSRGKYIETKIR